MDNRGFGSVYLNLTTTYVWLSLLDHWLVGQCNEAHFATKAWGAICWGERQINEEVQDRRQAGNNFSYTINASFDVHKFNDSTFICILLMEKVLGVWDH